MVNLRTITYNLPLSIFIIFSLFLFFIYLPNINKAVNERSGGGGRGDQNNQNKKEVFLVTMVVSEVRDVEQRQLIRSSWWKFKDSRVAKVFVVANTTDGKQLDALYKEIKLYNDIIILDGVVESQNRYESLRVLEYLHSIPTNKRAYIGVLNGVPLKDDFYGDGYVNYMLGSGYILGSDLVGYIGRSQHLMRYYDWEDVTIGAHLGFIKGIHI